ncbi:MAG: deoxyribodipyrimidine photolyase [Micrococcales bacterium]|nr:deoxyribodipyrimidine photolyase [Micrococcales bacterium]
MTNRILYVPFDHLNLSHGVLATADKKNDLIVLVESKRMVEGEHWHKQRLFFLISSARHFAAELKAKGFQVEYIKAADTISGLKKLKTKAPIYSAEPSSFRQYKQLAEYGVNYIANDLFVTSRRDFFDWASKQKTFVMENFYRLQRQRLGILVTDGKPEGGVWNFDKDNRLGPPKNYNFPEPLRFKRDAIDLEVAKELKLEATETWATTRKDAIRALNHFVENNLEGFGPYEDASTNSSWTLHHSLLSPYLNNGLLHAAEVVDAAVERYRLGGIPIQSVEAFVRQVIGWREYINGMYWFLGEDYRENNQLGADRQLLVAFKDSSKTKMNCVSSVVSDVEKRAWTHHIPRLMILSNLALITGTNPQQFLDWMRENFIDAAEWVMVPNVVGMGVHADGGKLMTKPYAAGGAYISRMTEYCKGCVYDPKKRSGDDACPFTTLYWDFLDRHRKTFKKNHRMSQQVNGLNRLSDLPELRKRAKQVLKGLDEGAI